MKDIDTDECDNSNWKNRAISVKQVLFDLCDQLEMFDGVSDETFRAIDRIIKYDQWE